MGTRHAAMLFYPELTTTCWGSLRGRALYSTGLKEQHGDLQSDSTACYSGQYCASGQHLLRRVE